MDITTDEDINKLIFNKIEESIHLDFKRGDALVNDSACKKEIAKDVSAFANSDGGIIIYGIEEVDHVADNIIAVDGNVITKEWLEQVINSNITRRISNLIVTPIRMNGDINTTVYVVNIPKSLDAPHMTNDKKYYKRFNFQSVQMEEYEIRELFNRPNFVKLEISECVIESGGQRSSPKSLGDRTEIIRAIEFHIAFQIENIGKSIETIYKLEITTDVYFHSSHEPYNPIKEYLVRKEGDNYVYSIPNDSPIFQNEKTTVIRASFTLEREHYLKYGDKFIKCKLYYSTGVVERTFLISEIIRFEGRDYNEIFI